MKTIGYRKSGIGIAYIFALIFGVGLIIVGCFIAIASKDMANESVVFLLGGILVVFYAIIQLIEFHYTKQNVISTDGEKMKINDNEFFIKDIVDVSYRKESYRGGQYNHGDITVKTKDSCYIAQFVADCEAVSKEITKLMYEKKNSNE